jgi:hypothetical protein
MWTEDQAKMRADAFAEGPAVVQREQLQFAVDIHHASRLSHSWLLLPSAYYGSRHCGRQRILAHPVRCIKDEASIPDGSGLES